MSFSQEKYQIIKKAISPELAKFCFDYFMLKRDAVDYLYRNNIIDPNPMLGIRNDVMVPGVYSHYADMVMETLLLKMLPIMKDKTDLDLIPTYSYARAYERGSILHRHKDRPSCEISTTLNLGGDFWPIYLSPNENVGEPNGKDITFESKAKGIEVVLEPGDMLVYSGCELEHWRETFEGFICVQVFLHYNYRNGKYGESNLFDKRAMLGLPAGVNK